MNWQIFVSLSILASALTAILQKVLLKDAKINPVAYAAGFQLIIAFFLGIILLFKGFSLPALSPIFINLLMVPFLYTLGNISKFRSLEITEASEFTIILQAGVLVTVFISVVFLGESFHLINLFGLILVLAAIFLVTAKGRIKFNFSRGEFLAIFCAVCFGVAFTNDAYILRSFDLWTFTFLSSLTTGLAILVYLGKDFKDLLALTTKEARVGFVFSAISQTVAVLAIYGAYQVGRNAAQIASLMPTYCILVVLLAAVFLHERDRLPRKLVAATLAVLGIFLLK